MIDVTSIPLGEIANVVRGVTFSKTEASSEPVAGSLPVLRAGNIQDSLLLDEDLVYVPRAKVNAKQLLRRGDIVICTSSGSADVVGKTALAERDWEGSFGAFCAGIRANPKKCDPRYLFYYLRSPIFRSWTLRSSGANIKNIRKSELDLFGVPLPPLSEQRRIAAILDKADGVRRKRERLVSRADDLLRSAFVHMVGFKNAEHPDWELFRIEDLAAPHKNSMRTGPFGSDLRHSEFVDGGIAVLGIDNAVQNNFAWDERRCITEEKFEKLKRYQVYPGDVIITIMGTTGRSAVVPDDIPKAITTKHLATISFNKLIVVPEFLSFAIHSDPLIIEQIERANKGAIMDGLNLGIIKSLEIHLPPIELQRKFAQLLKMVNKMKQYLGSNAGSGKALFLSLSQRAFRGDL
jgi:type I restriction enzyme, S subunit